MHKVPSLTSHIIPAGFHLWIHSYQPLVEDPMKLLHPVILHAWSETPTVLSIQVHASMEHNASHYSSEPIHTVPRTTVVSYFI